MAKQTRKKYEEVYETLRIRILSGGLLPGDKLPNERALAADLGVAAMTLRKALDQLEQEGHLIRRRYHGTVIASGKELEAEERDFRIGLVVPTELRTVAHPVFSRLLNGVEGIASEMGARLELVVSNPHSATAEESLLKTIRESTVDGWVIPAMISPVVRDALVRDKTPKVLLHFADEELSGHFFECDNEKLAAQIGEHLLASGYRNAAMFYPKELFHLTTHFARDLAAYLEERGASMVARLFSGWEVAAGAQACRDLLDEGGDFDVAICYDDDIALGVLQALKERGRSVPEIGLIGAGDFPVGSLVSPSLTTIAIPLYQLGRDMTRLLFDLIQHRPVEPAHRSFQSKLIVRGSSSPKICSPPNLKTKSAKKA